MVFHNIIEFILKNSKIFKFSEMLLQIVLVRAVARALIGGGGGCIFIYSGSARLVSFEIKLISKEASRAEPEYMNIHPPPPQLAF